MCMQMKESFYTHSSSINVSSDLHVVSSDVKSSEASSISGEYDSNRSAKAVIVTDVTLSNQLVSHYLIFRVVNLLSIEPINNKTS